MLKLIIEDDEGRKTVVPFMRDEITIGRQEGNTIRLTERNVSRRHARLLRQNGHVVVEDLGSYNGVRINGERIQGPAQVGDGDLIQIGDYDLAVQREVPQPIAPTIRVPASALQAAIAQAESAAAAAEAAEKAAGNKESEEDSDDTREDTPSDAIGETTTVLPGRQQRRQSTAVIRLDQVEMNRPRRLENVEPEDAPRLIVVGPEFKGQEFVCIRTEMRVGRTEDNDIAIDHRSLSRLHAKIVREDTGEWRIIDMQSANGMSVNGEIYAQASLSHGDIVELGHVKMRFVGPGENASGLANDAAKGSKKGLVLTLAGLVLLGAAGGAAWFVFGQTPSSPEAPVAVAQPPPEETPAPPPDTAPPPTEPVVNTAPPPTAAEEKLQPVQDAITKRDFNTAVALLEAIGTTGKRSPRAEDLLKQARTEQEARKNLDQARRDFEAGKLQDAQKGLAAAETTVAFASERTELKAKVDTALKAADKPTNTTRPAAGTAQQASAATDSKALLEEGKTLLRQQKYQDAESYFRKCIAVDPSNASCHMWMGTTVARLGNFEKGAQFYREFLRLAPNDPNAAKVKKLIDDYEKSLKTGGGK
ncbi:Adenylate cyclase [Cystobacter fuscus DSM 2262]|uniref:Adenylate cyclase n=2 Tax=Cystobacter fuscus TaxID=43 RepID=S9R235_CYSF2|nr:Adenylate cyclase [Cystobacter fuscus DSM 2262]